MTYIDIRFAFRDYHYCFGIKWGWRFYRNTSIQKWSGFGQWACFTYGWNKSVPMGKQAEARRCG